MKQTFENEDMSGMSYVYSNYQNFLKAKVLKVICFLRTLE